MRRTSRVLLIAVIAAAMIGFAAAAADADIAVTMAGAPAVAKVGDTVTFTIVVTNGGPEPTTATNVASLVPTELTATQWACTGTGGAVCPAASGTGDVHLTGVALPVLSK